MIKNEIKKHFQHKRVVVTGATGLIGREVCRLLSSWDASILAISLDDIFLPPPAINIKIDLTDYKECLTYIKDADYVFHLAGVKGSPTMAATQSAKFFVPIVMINTNVLEAARINEIPRLVYSSSIGAYHRAHYFLERSNFNTWNAYDPPMDGYPGWAKLIGEMQIDSYRQTYKEATKDWAIVRFSNTYGPGDNFDPNNAMVIPSLIARIAAGENPLKIKGDGSPIRDFLFSADAAEGIILAAFSGTQGGFFNIGSGVGTSIQTLVSALKSASFTDFRCEYERPPSTNKPNSKVLDIHLARENLQFSPEVSLYEGLKRTWKWYLENHEEHLRKINYFR